ncbi:MAG: hypothetical protein ACOC38_04345 [Promethearchaeia archaeon]
MVVYDEGGNSAHDVVIITVVPRTIEYVMIGIGMLMGVIIIFILIEEFKEFSRQE